MKIGRYEIERELGRGAMGVVYLATDPRVKRKVAIKTWHAPEGLKPGLQAEFRERFLREAQAAGALNHPAIVTIYDADDDTDQNLPFIAMEYVEGRSLESVLEDDGPLDADLAFDQAGVVAGALGAAHAAGIVHRDIKPANLLIPAGSAAVKVADFGVARMASSELTRTGNTLGSPAYMSPEQVRGRHADGRSDLFSLAVVLYETLCGERPFAGNDLTSLAFAVVHEAHIPISRKRKGLPGGMDAFFDRALAKDPDERFADAEAFTTALADVRKTCANPASQTLVVCNDEATQVDGHVLIAEPDVVSPVGETVDSIRAPGETVVSTPASGRAEEVVAAGAAKAGVMAVRAGRATGSALTRMAAWIWRQLPVAGRKVRRMNRGVWAAVASLVATGVIVMAVWYMTSDAVTLTIEGTNGFRKAYVTVLVDGEAVWSRNLSAKKKKAAFMGKDLFNYGTSKFGGSIRIDPGKRKIVVEVLPKGEEQPYRESLRKRLKPGTRRTLEIKTGKGLGRPLSIDLE